MAFGPSDYRDLSGKYTALVSLEMIQTVGWKHFGTFLGKCSDLLEPDGRMLLQAITIDDRAYPGPGAAMNAIRMKPPRSRSCSSGW